jgi:glycosyltransferase involved in cell wall biosynthesis
VIGVVITAFNAESTIGAVVTDALGHASRTLVVDDGSRDRTAAHARDAGAEVLRHERNRGKGAALRTGFSLLLEEGVSAVITLDADLQHDPADIPRFVEIFRKKAPDLIVGSRHDDFTGMTRARRFGNRFSSRALQFFTGLELPDSQSGYRLYAAGFLRDLPLRRSSYDAEMEALLHAARGGRRIERIRIRSGIVNGVPTSNFRPWLDTYRICRTVVWFSVCEF